MGKCDKLTSVYGREHMVIKFNEHSIDISSEYSNVDVRELGLTSKACGSLYKKWIFNLGQLAKIGDISKISIGVFYLNELFDTLLQFGKIYSSDKIKDVDIFDRPIKYMFDISDPALINLHNHGVWSIADLVSKTRNELENFIEAFTAYKKLIKQMCDNKLPPTPDCMSGEKWLARLKELKEIENNSKNLKLKDEELNMENKNEVLEQIAREKFYEMLSSHFETLNLSVRSFNILFRMNKECIGDVVALTERDILRSRNAGKKIVENIKTSLEALNLELCPKDVKAEDWIKTLEDRFVAKEMQKNKSKSLDLSSKNEYSNLDINEIPEKYRETYCVGAMEMAKREMTKQGVSGGIISRRIAEIDEKLNNLPHSNVLADKKVKLTYPKQLKDIDEMDDMEILKAVKENALLINDLQDSFIKKYAKTLIKIILENSSIDVEKRLELLDLLYNANQDGYKK